MSGAPGQDLSDGSEPDATTNIAVVGMAGTFPGAPDVDALWRLVRDGRDGLTSLSDAELVAAGVPAAALGSDYVKRAGVLADVASFDADFFGIGARDAAIMDPQHRHFYECAWAALESAGCVPERFDGAIGVFAGCGMNTYLINNLLTNPTLVEQLGWFLLRHTANDKDFLTTGTSYRLDLRGPSVNVQTACSTSLVAVHLAVQSLLGFECDLALAGGVTIEVPHGVGYRHHEGEVLASDGRCRAYDSGSTGTVLSSGVGVVALRRLEDALLDGDPILAVIRGSAVNNDGNRKVGFLAPSVDGHADVVREALAVAAVNPATITLLEGHGTGTAVGDPIEVAALTMAFREATEATGYCRLTSSKPNIGHLDTAAGVASLIKVVQSLRHRWLPPMANFTSPNELLDLATTPFVVSPQGSPWDPGDHPRRAGVSSLGVGGTNAHVIVEEAPRRAPVAPPSGPHLLLVSARTERAADAAASRLADFLEHEPSVALGDVAHTLLEGRRRFAHRRAVAAPTVAIAATHLRGAQARAVARREAPSTAPDVIFTFPGGGTQYPAMAAGLLTGDGRFDGFRLSLAETAAAIQRTSGLEVLPLLSADALERDDAAATMRRASVSLPTVFAVAVGVARLLESWGVRPRSCAGHSLGEYVAAHLAGVLTLEDAVTLVCRRAALVESVGRGALMAAVPLPEAVLVPLLGPVSLATVNTSDECVVSGSTGEVEALVARLAARGVEARPIPLAAAGHSSLLDPVLDDFAATVATVRLSPPTLPYVSNVSGTWITGEEATDPGYWVRHLRGTVRFAEGLATALAEGPAVVLEVGPGNALTSYARRQVPRPLASVATMRRSDEAGSDDGHLLTALGQLWTAGVDADWPVIVTGPGADPAHRRRKVTLPTYPFERTRHWIDAGATAATPAAPVQPAPVAQTIDRWAEEPSWQLAPPPLAGRDANRWLVLAEDPGDPVVVGLSDALRRRGALVETARETDRGLLATAQAVVIVGSDPGHDAVAALKAADARWLELAGDVVSELAGHDTGRLALVTRSAWVLDDDRSTADEGVLLARAAQALAAGPAQVVAAEHPGLTGVAVDLPLRPTADDLAAAAEELVAGTLRLVAVRDGRRFERVRRATSFEPVGSANGSSPVIVAGSVWLVTGGLGGIGATIAHHLAEQGCSLIITSSAPLPCDRAAWRRRHGPGHPTARRLSRLAALEATGVDVRVEPLDVADHDAIKRLFSRLDDDGIRLAGVVHAAGALVDRPLATVDPASREAVIGAKARGSLVLADQLAARGSATLVLCSSTSTVLTSPGQSTYVAANSVLDALAGSHGDLRVLTVNWGVWAREGMAADAARRATDGLVPVRTLTHPVLHELAKDRTGRSHALGSLDVTRWIVDQHRLADGTALVPGTGLVELMLASLRANGEPRAALRGVVLVAPLVVPDDATVDVRVVIDPSERSRRVIRLETAAPGGEWRSHAEADVVASSSPSPWPTDVIDGDQRDRWPELVGDPFGPQRVHLRLGHRWDGVQDARRAGTEAVGTTVLPSDGEDWVLDPAVADLATALGVALLADEGPSGLWVPVGYETVATFGRAAPGATLQLHARRHRHQREDGTADIDLRVLTDDGEVIAAIQGLTLRNVSDPTVTLAAAPEVTRDRRPVDAGAGGPLLALARGGGIDPELGAEAFSRALAGSADRLIISSVDLDTLLAPVEADDRHDESDGPSGGDTLDVVTAIWLDLLGVEPIGPDDDFFELGGHSLIAVRVVARVHRRLGVRLGLAALVEAPTPVKLAALIDAEVLSAQLGEERGGDKSPRCLVPIKPVGEGRPLFVVHGAGGNVLNLWSLARHLPASRRMFGLQAAGVDGIGEPDSTIVAMASRYVCAVRQVQPGGPYLLAGYSGGGIVALEMADQLQRQGERVAQVIMFDTSKPEPRGATRLEQVRNLARSTRTRGVGPTASWLGARFRQHLAGDEEAPGYLNLEGWFATVVRSHRFSTYRVPVLLLRAAAPRPTMDPDYGWSDVLPGGWEEIVVAGSHESMFAPEHAEELARVVGGTLDHIDPPGAG